MWEMASWMPWLLSAVTITMTVAAGEKHRRTWVLGLLGQALWGIWVIDLIRRGVPGAWGLLPMNVVLTLVYIRNHFKWQQSKAELPNGLTVLQSDPGIAVDLRPMSPTRNWAFINELGGWIAHRRLTPEEIERARRQAKAGIVLRGPKGNGPPATQL